MCGIVALWDDSLDEPSRVRAAKNLANRIGHRGPDGEGLWRHASAPLVLAHRRLAIQGLGDQGIQPMIDPAGRGALIYNGELFDRLGALRDDLAAAGFPIQGRSDTEVLMQALVRWGLPAALEKIEGQFAFVWYDIPNRRLFAARDQLGIRPVYISRSGRRLAIASEQKSLLPLPWVDRAPRTEGLLRFLLLGRTDDVPGETLVRGIESLPPGHWADWDGDRLAIHRYYRAPDAPAPSTIADIRMHLDRSVGGQLIGEVPIGLCVSGGVDSSSIAVVADHLRVREHAPETLHLFAYHDDAAQQDERRYQQAVLDSIVSPHEVHWVSSTPRALVGDFENYIDHQEEPYADVSSYGEYCLARAAKESGVKVLLNGLGGDEVFAGYVSFFGPVVIDILGEGEFAAAMDLLRVAPAMMGSGRVSGALKPLLAAAYHSLPARVRNVATAVRRARSEGIATKSTRTAAADAWSSWHPHDGSGATNAALRGAIESWCIPRYLSHSDRMGLAHGVENRVPLLDTRLIAAAFGIPPSQRFGTSGLKASLRAAVSDLLPPLVRERAWKLGFHVPLEPYIAALEEPLREGTRVSADALGERVRWESQAPDSQWRWGILGLYLRWIENQTTLTGQASPRDLPAPVDDPSRARGIGAPAGIQR